MLRAATDEDRAAVLALGVAEETAWFGAAEVSAEEVGEWVDEEGGLAAGVVTLGPGAEVLGFVSPGRFGTVLLADPTHTDATMDDLIPWLLGRRADAKVLTFAGDAARVAALERHGLRHERSTFTLARPAAAGPLPDAAFPDGVDVAPYRLGEDDEAVHRLIYRDAEWAAVPGHTERDFERWRELAATNTALILARRDGRPAGWVTGRVLDSGRGYVPTLAVATADRGRGLGRALLVRACAELQRSGAEGLTLDVEASNETALGLYRSVGFDVEREWRILARA